MRRDKCKCGKIITWDTDGDYREVVCKVCGVAYSIECDSVLVYWLEEMQERKHPYKTEAR